MNVWPAVFSAISDLLINMSAGWFGAVFIVPNFTRKQGKEKLLVLINDLALGIISLVIAILVRLELI